MQIEHNKASVGGGIGGTGSVTLQFYENVWLKYNMAVSGGAIGTNDAVVSLTATKLLRVEDNKASYGGAIHLNSTYGNIRGLWVENNIAAKSGGGIGVVNSTLTMSNINCYKNNN